MACDRCDKNSYIQKVAFLQLLANLFLYSCTRTPLHPTHAILHLETWSNRGVVVDGREKLYNIHAILLYTHTI